LVTLILKSDSYKFSHWKQYPKGTTKVYSYLESRGGKFDNTVFYGLQYILKKYFEGIVITEDDVNKAKNLIDRHIGPDIFNYDGWMIIAKELGGKIPIKIKAVPEGLSIPVKNVLMTVENTDDRLPWITNFCESLLLQVWFPTTISTLSREIKKKFIKYLKKTTSYSKDEILNILSFLLNDFGYRGCSSDESAAIGGSAHIVNFSGTDNVSAINLITSYYNTDNILAFSIPASEHSTITSWGEANEVKAMENMLDSYPTGLVACVSDSFDIIRACEQYWGGQLKDKIMSRNGRLVIRPDSGDPVQTLKKVFNILWEKFGGTINDKGFKVLHPNVRVIQGDGVNYESIGDILDMMIEEGFSVENIAFGMGGALLQKVDRDTQKFAFKCSHIVINGEEVDVRKNPIEIDEMGNRVASFKQSKAGKLKLMKNNLKDLPVEEQEIFFEYFTQEHSKDEIGDELVTVFENGHLLKEWTFEEIRERAQVNF
jgi:nicotinamide phosphoribosyltransferase